MLNRSCMLNESTVGDQSHCGMAVNTFGQGE